MTASNTQRCTGYSRFGRGEAGEHSCLSPRDPQESVLMVHENWRIPVDFDTRRVNELIVGLGDVEVLAANDTGGLLGFMCGDERQGRRAGLRWTVVVLWRTRWDFGGFSGVG